MKGLDFLQELENGITEIKITDLVKTSIDEITKNRAINSQSF